MVKKVSKIWKMISASYPTFWCKPLSGYVKFNYDAIVLDNNSTIAIVARDHNGKVMQIWSILLKKLIV